MNGKHITSILIVVAIVVVVASFILTLGDFEPAILRPHVLPEQFYEITIEQNKVLIARLDLIIEELGNVMEKYNDNF